MSKKYSIEVPLYSYSLNQLDRFNRLPDVAIRVFGGIPDSPLHGGRFNYTLDGQFLWDRFLFRMGRPQLDRVSDKFFRTVRMINAKGIPFHAVLTNLFVEANDLQDSALKPIRKLAELGETYGVRNGVIINNRVLEDRLRHDLGNRLAYFGSCTKYVAPDRILTPRETMTMYRADCRQYDAVIFTPQDSRRESLLKELALESQQKIIVIANTYCSNGCNCYDHYAYISRQNKISMLKMSDFKVLFEAGQFVLARLFNCGAVKHCFFPINIRKTVRMQLRAGIVHFKLGRGIGSGKLKELVELIRCQETKSAL
jgi:hypothetical protein